MRKNMIKMGLDIVMFILLALLCNNYAAAMTFHEIAGLAFCGLIVIHCLLNIKWIISVSKRFFSKSLAPKVRAGYIVNLLLIITFAIILISGTNASQILNPSSENASVWRAIHRFSGAISIILIGIHLGLHWSFISGMWRKLIKIKDGTRKVIAFVLLAMVLSFGVYSIATTSFANWLIEPQAKAEQYTKTIGGTSDPVGEIKKDDSAKLADASRPLNFIYTMVKFISIMVIFAVITYYIEKMTRAKKRDKDRISSGVHM